MLLNFADITLLNKGQLYFELYSKIKTAVADGIIKKGEKLPSVREASAQLGVSRTTVENAYTRLCIEGIAESLPQRGYYILGMPRIMAPTSTVTIPKTKVKYDFSSRLVDAAYSDTELWKRLIRSVLCNTDELNSYGDPQGELSLRQALADYTYKARGVITTAENIVIGAGVGPLLNILCGLLGRDITVGFENEGFGEAKQIFTDYGIKTYLLNSDSEGTTKEALEIINPDILFLLPSALSKISPTALSNRRNHLANWVKEQNRLIIEDDYNGELRYTAHSVPAFQRKVPEKTIYIGSFSKLLLPSVRIAYMVLPDFLIEKFRLLPHPYNQTCGKIEQLTLEKYITTYALEKHLKKLRRLYYTKSQLLIKSLEDNLECLQSVKLYESSLKAEVKLNRNFGEDILKKLELEGVKIAKFNPPNKLTLCFAGIDSDKILEGVKILNKIFGKM